MIGQNSPRNCDKIKVQNCDFRKVSQPYNYFSSRSTKILPTKQQNMLMNLLHHMQENTKKISDIQKSFEKTNGAVLKTTKIEPIKIEHDQKDKGSINTQFSNLTSLLKNRKHEYKFQISEEFPSILYKERNFTFKIRLTTFSGQPIKNTNVLSISLGICNEGKWVSQSKFGGPILKGNTEIQMHKGTAIFQKVSVRDLSRYYQGGKVDLVVFCKPTALLNCAETNFDQIINESDIQPLLIRNIAIKSKRKS